MSTPHGHDDPDGGSEHERDLEELQRPMDDPQTRPALDPDVEPPEDV